MKLACAYLCVMCVLQLSRSPDRAYGDSIDAILNQWKSRCEAVHCFHFRWRARAVHVLEPNRVYSYEGQYAWDQSDKTRFDYTTVFKPPFSPNSDIEATPSVYVFDSKTSVMYFPKYEDKVPKAFIGDGARGIGPNIHHLPITLNFKLFDTRYGGEDRQTSFDPYGFVDTGQCAVISGVDCKVIRYTNESCAAESEHLLFVSNDPRHLPLRYVSGVPGVPRIEVDISYEQNEQGS